MTTPPLAAPSRPEPEATDPSVSEASPRATAAAPPTGSITARTYLAALRVGDLFLDPTYQAEPDQDRLSEISRSLDPSLLGVLEVSARPEGRFAILDGKTRWGALRRAAGENAHLVARVRTQLSIADEAHLCARLTHASARRSWWTRWRERRAAGDPIVHAIDEMLHRHHLKVDPAPRHGHIRATTTLEVIVERLGGLPTLDRALGVLVAAFGYSPAVFDAALIHGTALVIASYPPETLNTRRLVDRLTGLTAHQLRARAAAQRGTSHDTLARLCASVIVARYNTGTGPRLDPLPARATSSRTAATRQDTARGEPAKSRRQPATIHPEATHEPNRHDADEPDCSDSPLIAVPDPAGIHRAFANGLGLRWVMDTYGLDYATARSLRRQLSLTPADAGPANHAA